MEDVSITQKKNWMSRKGGMSKIMGVSIMATVDVIPLWPFPYPKRTSISDSAS